MAGRIFALTDGAKHEIKLNARDWIRVLILESYSVMVSFLSDVSEFWLLSAN